MTIGNIMAAEWIIGRMIGSIQRSVASYGPVIVAAIGIVMVIAGVFQVAKNLMSHGKGQANWVVTLALIIIGGAFAVTGGWSTLGKFANSGNTTLEQMSQGEADTLTDADSDFTFGGGGSGGDD